MVKSHLSMMKWPVDNDIYQYLSLKNISAQPRSRYLISFQWISKQSQIINSVSDPNVKIFLRLKKEVSVSNVEFSSRKKKSIVTILLTMFYNNLKNIWRRLKKRSKLGGGQIENMFSWFYLLIFQYLLFHIIMNSDW